MNSPTSALSRLKSWLRSITGRTRLESDMDDEISFHLDARTADLTRSGLSADEARRRARLEFGTLDTHKDSMRHSLGLRWWDELFADLRYSTRILKKSPGFTIIAVASLALAIGANTTIFSAANEMLFEKLGVPHPDQLRYLTLRGDGNLAIHSVWGTWNQTNGKISFASFSYPVYQLLKSQNVLEPLFAFKDLGGINVTANGSAQAVDAELVSGNLYQQMQVQPALGRPILPADDSTPNAGAVVILSDGFWKRAFGRSPNVIGKIISVNSSPVTIIGVNPPEFTGAKSVQRSPEIFMPLSMIERLVASNHRGSYLSAPDVWWLQLMARAQPGVSMQQAQAALSVQLNAAIRSTVTVKPGETLPRLVIEDGSKGLNFTGQTYSQPLYVLMAMVGLVLLLACANMANLMLARASSRQKEMSVRLALGAGRWRILRQVLTESLLLSLLGGSLGLLISYSRRTALPKLFSSAWEVTDVHIPFDWRVFGFTAGITILTGLLFGLAPAWAATRAEISTALKQGSTTASRSRRHFSGKAIVAFQVALSTLLVFAAGIFLRSIINLNSIDPGFRPDHLVLFDLAPPSLRYPSPKDVQLHTQVEEAIRAVPGVTGVSPTDIVLVGNNMNGSLFHVDGSPLPRPDREDQSQSAMYASVGRDFLSTMQIPLIAGRNFNAQDTATSPLVALVNQVIAQKFFPGQNPIGKRFANDWNGKDTKWITIIGVFSNVRYNNLRDQPPPLYLQPYFQQTGAGTLSYVIRTPMKPEDIVPSLRAAVQRIDRDLPLMDVRTQQQQIDATTQQERIFASLTAGFGLLALALACVGIYGIMAYTVSQRTNEIGIRLALGAERQQVRSMVLKEATQLAILGAVIGLVAALLLGRVVGTMLYGLKPADPLSLAAAGSLLLAIALISSWIPANRASRVEPMEALRHE